MTGPVALIESVLARVDWLAGRGALAMRMAAYGAWGGAAAATLAAFTPLGGFGWLLGALSLIPGRLLWNFGRRLGSALDVDKIRGQLGEAAGMAKARLGEVAPGTQTSVTRLLRRAWRVLMTVRTVRSDLAGFGVDVAEITQLANPGRLGVTAGALLAGFVLWVIAAIAILIRAVV